MCCLVLPAETVCYLYAASPGARGEEVSEAEAEVLEVDLAIAVVVEVSEDDVTVALGDKVDYISSRGVVGHLADHCSLITGKYGNMITALYELITVLF